ncbi:hypothetical protein QKU48_gp1206 [Fadolivirus algeromassiliense]|jgi:hypothetical protein|uniref:Uncharacterized protein n=1 Tax=Fadolivirus FV1/VV64 TaxID=3070911 RepID=A0A7D3QVV6_9VIRU|nr:hypothetical protein QKU48_gp1206 [Fadolivirus algeromassiliense]QKF94664.1 hypothetical protein Fadolivirus_1_1206 [Fadolivirus FV1/VV64]
MDEVLIDRLLVDRRGISSESYMKTEKFIGYIIPNKLYEIQNNNIIETNKNKTILQREITIPQHIRIPNKWYDNKNNIGEHNNILGNNGEFKLNSDLIIPVADTTINNLAFYDCVLLKHNDIIEFESLQSLPIFNMKIGSKYVDDFLLTNIGGGCYLEYHDTPHFHMPLNEKSEGYLILGKIINNDCYLSAFKIPYNYAIYTSPFTIHCDGYLVGEYLVVYTITENYSTVLLKNNDMIANVRISD